MKQNWIEYRSEACPICGHKGWCRHSVDGGMIICQRKSGGIEKKDQNGISYWLYPIKSNKPFQSKPKQIIQNIPEIASPHDLHQVYSQLLSLCPLSESHQQNLILRGLPFEEIQLRQYGTLSIQGRTKIAQQLVDTFGYELCKTIPGLVEKQGTNGSHPYWSLAGYAGLLIPVRDVEARIVALKIRVDDDSISSGKYHYFSSLNYGGPGPGSPVHIPIFNQIWKDQLIVTEGELKADIATVLGKPTLSIPGVTMWRKAIPILKQFDISTVIIAFDSDLATNPVVCKALLEFRNELTNFYKVEVLYYERKEQ